MPSWFQLGTRKLARGIFSPGFWRSQRSFILGGAGRSGTQLANAGLLGCRADRASGNKVYLYFTIRDNGSSIASDLMQGMFEMKDERDDPLRARLYIAREIVSIMGGNVRVRSRRGEGTEFMVTVCMRLP